MEHNAHQDSPHDAGRAQQMQETTITCMGLSARVGALPTLQHLIEQGVSHPRHDPGESPKSWREAMTCACEPTLTWDAHTWEAVSEELLEADTSWWDEIEDDWEESIPGLKPQRCTHGEDEDGETGTRDPHACDECREEVEAVLDELRRDAELNARSREHSARVKRMCALNEYVSWEHVPIREAVWQAISEQ